MAITVAFGLMGAFFLAGLYVAAALGCLSLIIMYFFSDAPLWNIMANKAWESNTSFILVAVPLFILMGELMNRSGMGEKMYQVISKWIFFLPGGLIHTNIVSCAIFAACSGSSVATSATISRVSLPAFRQRGYSERMVIGSLAAGGTLGILIPPSISLIIYGVLVEESIGRLYLAGFIPGFMLAGMFMLMIAIVALFWKNMAPREEGASFTSLDGWVDRIVSLVGLLPMVALIFVVLGTIYTGIATPTEAAAFGVSGAFVLAIVMNSQNILAPLLAKFLNMTGLINIVPDSFKAEMRATNMPDGAVWRETLKLLGEITQSAIISTIRTTGMIFLIVLAAFTLSFAFARLGISQDIADMITGWDLSPTMLVLVLIVFYLILGTFMESFAMLVTTVPILLPTLEQAGVDLVWFGILMVILVEAALISPPEGINLYVLHGVRQDVDREQAELANEIVQQSTIADVWIGVLPFMGCMGITVILIMLFPEIALWLPDLVKGSR
ncbi:MAG: TRAP transporter large permease subunit [Chloroflexi bacterium]|nr:TRAP transporter large permease subunit [Chloroflexota bacterium]